MRESNQITPTPEELLQELRSKATELLLREEWQESIKVYTQLINLCQDQIFKLKKNQDPDLDLLTKLQKSLCLVFSNRAEARSRLRDFDEAIKDCDQALKIESTHFKSLLCKGKILLSLNKYSMALECFKMALIDSQDNGNLEIVSGYVEKCKKLESQSRTGAFDLSDWVLSGFRGKSPELADYIGAVEIKMSELSGRGLFATKNLDAGSLVLVTKAIATERGLLSSEDPDQNAQLVMWKNFIDNVVEAATKCSRIHHLINTLSTGEEEDKLKVPENGFFTTEAEEFSQTNEKLDMARILNILDVNSLVEDSVSAKVLGKNSVYYGVGLWVPASFINHSCNPNVRRLHIGDYAVVHTSRDVKAGEEITLAYFDVLSPLDKRKEMSKTWGFVCGCKRCKFEEEVCSKQEMKEIEMGLERGMEVGSVIFRLEEGMRRLMVRGKEKGYLRASFWPAYSKVYGSEKLAKRWGRRIPGMNIVVDSVTEAIGSNERVLKVLMEGMKITTGFPEMERTIKLWRGLYGKVMKKPALKSLIKQLA